MFRISLILVGFCLLCSGGSRGYAFGTFIQSGANHGLFALGPQFEPGIFKFGLSFGFTPSLIGGNAVVQLNSKNMVRIYETNQFKALTGVGLFINASDVTFFVTPGKYPKGYYPPNAYYFAWQNTLYWGDTFLELSVIDYYLEVLAQNPWGSVPVHHTISIGVGVDF